MLLWCRARDNLNAIAGAQGTILDQILQANPQVRGVPPVLMYVKHISTAFPYCHSMYDPAAHSLSSAAYTTKERLKTWV